MAAKSKPEQTTLDFEVSVSTRLPASELKELDAWAERNFSDRSKFLKAITRTVLRMVRDQGGFEQGLNDVLRRLRLEPA